MICAVAAHRLRAGSLLITLALLFGCNGRSPDPVAPAGVALLQAVSAYEDGDYHRALEAIDRSIAADDRARTRVIRGALLLFARRFDEAEGVFRSAIDSEQTREGALVGLAHIHINNKEYSLAAPSLEAAATPPAGSSGTEIDEAYRTFVFELACLGLGWAAANTNQHVRAISWFDRVLARQSDDLLALLGRGNSLIGLNLLDDAEKVLEQVLSVHPDNPYALAELGMIRLKKGDDIGAEERFQAALARDDKRYTCPHEGLGLLYLRQGRTDQAKSHLEAAIRINPDIEYKKYNGLARIYIEEGNLDEAERLLRKSVENFPHDAEAARLLEQLRAKPSTTD